MIALVTSMTYGLAVLHKLNYDFLFTSESCAIHGVEISLSLFPFEWLQEIRMLV